jgi:hypothetical protein
MVIQKPKIVLFNRVDRWRCALEYYGGKTFGNIEFMTVEDIPTCVRMIASIQPAITIVECDTSNVEQICRTFAQHYSEFGRTILAAVGDHVLVPWTPLLEASGFSQICVDMTQVQPFTKRIERYLAIAEQEQAVFRSKETLEERIEDQLPWRPIARHVHVGE